MKAQDTMARSSEQQSSALYAEGDLFAVPLPSGGYAVGLVARIAPGARVAFGYFFGPKRTAPPSASSVDALRPEDAILRARFGDLGIVDGSWKYIGRLSSYDRAAWGMPDFQRKAPLDSRHLRVHYRDENPNSRPLETAISERDAAALPHDALLGAVAVGRLIESLLEQGSKDDA